MASHRCLTIASATLFAFAWLAAMPGTSRAVITFTDVGAALPGTYYDAVDWGDYDGDGDLDLLHSGGTGGLGDCHTGLYRCDYPVAGFTLVPTSMPALMSSVVAWGDYDNDNDLDILLAGLDADLIAQTRIYRNDGAGAFVEIEAGLPDVHAGSAAWGDCDNDGDLDLLLSGTEGYAGDPLTAVYRNENGLFSDIGAGLTAVSSSSVAWGDYDLDGDLDVLLAGLQLPSGHPVSAVFRNDGGTFVDIAAGLTGVSSCSADWGDYDNDGDLDILLAGNDAVQISAFTALYRNDGAGLFTEIDAGLPAVRICAVDWGDYDNDGDLDVLLAGKDESAAATSRVYRNDGGTFTDTGSALAQLGEGSAAWADFDADGDLDLVLTGRSDDFYLRAYIYSSYGATPNTPPAAPTGLASTAFGNQVLMSWDAATDGQTPTAALCYNLRIGTTPGGSQIMSAMAGPLSGHRHIVGLGHAQMRRSWTVTVPDGTYYWTVQAIDGAFAGSPLAPVQSGSVSSAPSPGPEGSVALEVVSPLAGSRGAALRFDLAAPAAVTLRLFDAAGRCQRTLLESSLPAGRHEVAWDGADDRGARLPPGVYFCRLEAGAASAASRLIRIE